MSERLSSVGLPRLALDDGAVLRGLAWLSATHLRAVAALVLLALACFLPGLGSIAPVDRDEARFAQATRQMLETGDLVDIRLHDEPRYKKPVGIYWLQAAVVTLTGQGADAPIAAYRLASTVGALAAVLLLYWAAAGLFDRRAGLVAAALFALALVVTVEAHLAKTDAALVAAVVLAQGALGRVYVGDARGSPPLGVALLFWIGVGLGVLIKGPIVLMVSGLTVLALVAADRRAAWLMRLRPLIGVPVALAIVLPWLAAILSVAGADYLQASLGEDLFGKLGSGQEGHGAPPGSYLLALLVTFWPAVALVPLAAPWVWRNRRLPPVRFCLAWLLPAWIVFEIVATKLPHYTLPTYPAIAALIGAAVAAGGLASGRWWSRLAGFWPAAFALALPVAGVAALLWLEGVWSAVGLAVSVAAAGLAFGAARAGLRDAPLTMMVLLAAAAVAGYAYVFAGVLPRLETFRVSPRIAAAAAAAAPCPEPALAAAGFEEPSLIFLTDTGIRFADGRGAADFLAEGGCRVALVEAGSLRRFERRAARLGLVLDRAAVVEGVNIGNLRPVAVGVYAAGGAP